MPSTRRDVEVWRKASDEVADFKDITGDRLFLRAAENELGDVVFAYANHSSPGLPADHIILERITGETLTLGRGHGLYPVGLSVNPDNTFEVFWQETATKLVSTTVTPSLVETRDRVEKAIAETSKGILDVIGHVVILTDTRPFIDIGPIKLQDAIGRLHLTVGILAGSNNWVMLHDAQKNKFYVLDDSGENQLHPRLAVSVLTGNWKVALSYGEGRIITVPLREYPINGGQNDAIEKLNRAITLINEAKGLID